MPYPSEHAVRLHNPNFEEYRRTKGGKVYGKTIPSSVSIIWGKRGGTLIPQALRFPVSSWTIEEVRNFIKKNKIKYISIEPAASDKFENISNESTIIKYVNDNLDRFYNMVSPTWDYTKIDKKLVQLVFKAYSDALELTSAYQYYDDVLINLYQYAVAKVTRFFYQLHELSKLKISNSLFIISNSWSSGQYEIIKNVAKTIFLDRLKTELNHIKHITTQFKRFLSVKIGGLKLKYISKEDSKVRPKHADADGIIRPATDPIWQRLILFLSEWNCRCQINEVKRAKSTTDKELDTKIEKINKVSTYEDDKKASASEIDLSDNRVIVFKGESKLFKDYTLIRKKFRNPKNNE